MFLRTSSILSIAVLLVTVGGARSAHAQHLLHGASGLDHGIPDLCANPTISSARDGNWSEPSTWTPARVPQTQDRVAVTSGTTVTYDTVGSTIIQCVGTDGVLRFRPDVDTQLTVGTLLVRPSGALEVGTAATPVASGRTATIVIADLPVDTNSDPEQFGTGLIVTGRVRMHGQIKPRTFVRARSDLGAGQSTFEVDEDLTGWSPGDRLLVPDSRYLRGSERPGGWSAIETPILAQTQGRYLTVTAALSVTHPAARNGDGTIEFPAHVGNLSRNVVVRSQNPNGTRGHSIFVARADVDLRYVRFQDLGRTTLAPLDSAAFDSQGRATRSGSNQIGRYAVHFHHLLGPSSPPQSGYQYTFVGNVIEGATKWGITIHRSHYGLIRDNILFDTKGSAIMTEDGSESFNAIERNLIVKVLGDGTRGDARANSTPPDWGIEGAGIWLRGPNNYVRNNVVANVTMYGYMMLYGGLGTVKIPAYKGADPAQSGQGTDVNFAEVRNLEFADNETYSITSGMSMWYVTGPTMLSRLRIWHASVEGFSGYPQTKVVMDGWVIRGDPAALADPNDFNIGIHFGDYDTRETLIVRADIQNMRVGIIPPLVAADPWTGPSSPTGTVTIQDSYFRNYQDIMVTTMYFNGGGNKLSPKTTVIRNSRFVPPLVASQPANPQAAIAMSFMPRQSSNLVQSDRVFVYGFNGVAGDDFQVFYREQAPDFVIPASGFIGNAEAGKTNQENWAQRLVSIGGRVTPCVAERPRVAGFVCVTNEHPGETTAPPNPPLNVRIVP